MSTIAGPSGLADELRPEDTELADTLDAAGAEVLGAPVPAPDARLAALLQAGTGEAAVVPLAPRRRTGRRLVLAGGTAAVAVVATAGLAAASVLPAPVQRAVSSVASKVGWDLPEPGADASEPVAGPALTSTTVAAATDTPPAAAKVAPSPPPSASPPSTAGVAAGVPRPQVAAYAAAVSAYRRCLVGAADPAGCTAPDPTDFGLPASAEPRDVLAFRRAVAAYVACLRATAGGPGIRACERPRPWDFGLVPRPTTPPTTPAPRPTPPTTATPRPTVPPTLPPRLEALRAAVVAYVACLKAAGDPAAAAACVRPDPEAFGFPAWPAGIVPPPRPTGGTTRSSSSPPVRLPPDPSPGTTMAPSEPAGPASTANRPGGG